MLTITKHPRTRIHLAAIQRKGPLWGAAFFLRNDTVLQPTGEARGPSTRRRQVGAYDDPVVAYHVADAAKLQWDERPPAVEGQEPRRAADVTSAAELHHSRGRVWRYPPGTRGRRHADKVQEEVFVVISGRLTMLLGDPYERIDVGPESVVAVEPGTPLQVRNESDEELVLYIYGAPPEQEGADFFDDVEL
jgi:mannose-6-phosphate isomerase-like protein (cupin superfamily)